jgi:hypothetical protein
VKIRPIEVRINSAMGDQTRAPHEPKAPTVQSWSIHQIKLNQRNSRTHSAKQIRQIANSIVASASPTPY